MTERGRFATALSGLRKVAISLQPDCCYPGFEIGHDHEESVSAERIPRGRFPTEAGGDVVRRRNQGVNLSPVFSGVPFQTKGEIPFTGFPNGLHIDEHPVDSETHLWNGCVVDTLPVHHRLSKTSPEPTLNSCDHFHLFLHSQIHHPNPRKAFPGRLGVFAPEC